MAHNSTTVTTYKPFHGPDAYPEVPELGHGLDTSTLESLDPSGPYDTHPISAEAAQKANQVASLVVERAVDHEGLLLIGRHTTIGNRARRAMESGQFEVYIGAGGLAITLAVQRRTRGDEYERVYGTQIDLHTRVEIIF